MKYVIDLITFDPATLGLDSDSSCIQYYIGDLTVVKYHLPETAGYCLIPANGMPEVLPEALTKPFESKQEAIIAGIAAGYNII